MAERILLGNIKGEKGEKGDKGDRGEQGDTGDITKVVASVTNKLDLSKLQLAQGEFTIDIPTGLVTYTGATWHFYQDVQLSPGTHSVLIQDFESDSTYYGGIPYFSVTDQNGDYTQYHILHTNNLYHFEIPKDSVYRIQVRVSNSVLVNGYFKGIMFVEGEYPLSYFPSIADIVSLTNGGN